MFFIDHNAKTTSFIDPRLPNDLPLLQSIGSGATPLPSTLLPPVGSGGGASLSPPPPPRHHGASLTPPPSARTPTTPLSPNKLAPPVDGVNRRRSRSVGDEELHNCFATPPSPGSPRPSAHGGHAPLSQVDSGTPMAYNEKVVAFLRQANILDILKEKNSGSLPRNLRDKISAIRQEGSNALKRFSHDVELTLLLR